MFVQAPRLRVGFLRAAVVGSHMVAWETRNKLGLDFVTAGVSGDPSRPDNIIFDVSNGFGHPNCLADADEIAAAAALTPVR